MEAVISLIKLDREELAWAAGFFDGEGCVTGVRPNGNRVYPVVSISQNDIEVLERFKNTVVVGSIMGPLHHNKKYPDATHYAYRTYGWRDTQFVIALIWNWLGTKKKEQATRRIKEFHSFPIPERKGRGKSKSCL